MSDLAPASQSPESHASFRRGQLLVLLAEFDAPMALDRIGYFEFFAANPHLVIRDGAESVRLQLAGFSPSALSYQSAPERFANRRSRLRTDLSALTAWGYATVSVEEGRIVVGLTDTGRERSRELVSLYADAYRASIDLVRPMFRLSPTALAKKASDWLAASDRHLDILDVDLNTQLQFNLDGTATEEQP